MYGLIFRFRSTLLILSVVIFMLSSVVFSSKLALAVTSDDTWSWADTKPVVVSSISVPEVSTDDCTTVSQTKAIDGYSDLQDLCMKSNDIVSFGTFYASFSYHAAVSYRLDTKMYKINGVCTDYRSCIYLPDNDVLVTRQYLTTSYVSSMVVYRNFSQRLEPVIKLGLDSTLEYNFNTENPDYILKDNDNYAWPVGAIGVSENSDWLAVEIRQRGIGMLNIKTLEFKRISNLVLSYGEGMDAHGEIAVSNDGKSVVVAGFNVGFTFLVVDSGCGDKMIDLRSHPVSSVSNPCVQLLVNPNDFIDHFRYATKLKFNYIGGELGFYAASYEREIRQVTWRAAGYTGQKLDYLAMGDSFTSGEGEVDDGYYLEGTNDEYEKCHVSSRSYPFVIAKLSHIDPLNMRSVACSGAVMGDVVGLNVDYWGQGGRLGESMLGLDKVNKSHYQQMAIDYFKPGRIHQESFSEKYQPKIITIGIGGNDAGFMGKLKTCVGFGTCDAVKTEQGREQTAIEIQNLFDKFIETYNEIHLSSPDSKIFVVGYPQIIDQDGDCGLSLGSVLNDAEKQFMNEGISYLNKVIAAAAKAAGVAYVDVQDSYGDHLLCGDETPSGANAIMTGDDSNMINNSRWLRFLGNESFHPNAVGHFFVAGSIVSTVGNIMEYEYCENKRVVCPDKTIVAPKPSEYWIGTDADRHDYPIQKNFNLVLNNDGVINGLNNNIQLAANSLAPDSPINITITSEPVMLGNFMSLADGSLDIDIDLPTDLEEGYHTLHLYGTSYSGESIELYQIIKYQILSVDSDDQIITGPVVPDVGLENNLANKYIPTLSATVYNHTTTNDSLSVAKYFDEDQTVLGFSDSVDETHSEPSTTKHVVDSYNYDFTYTIIGASFLGMVCVALLVIIRIRG
jgi:lysophospholipase L1-like esterase